MNDEHNEHESGQQVSGHLSSGQQVSGQQDSGQQDSGQQNSGQQDSNHDVERRICLPDPDADNITVLTTSLPNEPILPWHHFDSPWLEQAEKDADLDASSKAEAPAADAAAPADENAPQQLTLGLVLPE